MDNFDSQSEQEEDVTGLERAMAWEKTFIDFMLEWEEKEKPVFLEIAFNSKRSIEDELEKAAEVDKETPAEPPLEDDCPAEMLKPIEDELNWICCD